MELRANDAPGLTITPPSRLPCRRDLASHKPHSAQPVNVSVDAKTISNRGPKMKITIEIDCTPAEARQYCGLPDVQPMQAAMLAEVEKRMMAEAEKFSPEGLMKIWFSNDAQGADWFRNMFRGFSAKAEPNSQGGDKQAVQKKD
jgi:Family of unknown function (DUF6489)